MTFLNYSARFIRERHGISSGDCLGRVFSGS
jgi:hypothetical protein